MPASLGTTKQKRVLTPVSRSVQIGEQIDRIG